MFNSIQYKKLDFSENNYHKSWNINYKNWAACAIWKLTQLEHFFVQPASLQIT